MKTILVGVSGSIAAYKACDLVRALIKLNYDVEVVMTENATKFISPLTLGALINKKVLTDDFDEDGYQIKHISYAKKADLFVIVPASGNVIAKLANGIADDVLTSCFLAATCPKLIAPAMNVNMFNNEATKENIQRLLKRQINFVAPGYGLLACGDMGQGKLADLDDILTMIEYSLAPKPLKNKKVLVTAGPTQEAIDPVRFISNHSSGKMGYALARQAFILGGQVTLISGPVNLKPVYGVNQIDVISANDMFQQVKQHYQDQDFIIKAAAVGDYRSENIAENKIKKHDHTMTLNLVKNEDILAYLGNHKTKQIICGFAMETIDLINHAKEKFINKNCDLLVANNLKDPGAGFQVDTNKVTFITKEKIEKQEIMSKEEVAKTILNKLLAISKEKEKC